MTIFFPQWAATVLIWILWLACVGIGLCLLWQIWHRAVDAVCKTFKCSRAFVKFLLISEYRRQGATAADLEESEKRRHEKTMLAEWALMRLHVVTDGAVGKAASQWGIDLDDAYLGIPGQPELKLYADEWRAYQEKLEAEKVDGN